MPRTEEIAQVVGVKNATKAAMAWYVSYRTGGTTRMRILRGRVLAIDVACRFFDPRCHKRLKSDRCLGLAKETCWTSGTFGASERPGHRHQSQWRGQIVVVHCGEDCELVVKSNDSGAVLIELLQKALCDS